MGDLCAEPSWVYLWVCYSSFKKKAPKALKVVRKFAEEMMGTVCLFILVLYIVMIKHKNTPRKERRKVEIPVSFLVACPFMFCSLMCASTPSSTSSCGAVVLRTFPTVSVFSFTADATKMKAPSTSFTLWLNTFPFPASRVCVLCR